MLFSCKITHSVINYLDRRGEDLEVLYENCDWPAEFLRDPSSWLEADKMESVLKRIHQDFGSSLVFGRENDSDEPLITTVGHHCKDLRSWGVLDSVLRMVQAPKDLFAQPERFLSYFVSPAPPVGDIQRKSDSVSFVLPVSEEQFPFVTTYLRAALEALPTYINKPMASVQWDNSRVVISWSESQASLFGEGQNVDLSLHPELVQNILQNLESSQKQLEEMKREIIVKDEEIARLKTMPMMSRDCDDELPPSIDGRVGEILHELYRLGDYVARGQQLVTLLVGAGRSTPQVQEAMRRVDWEFVSKAAPELVRRTVADLQKVQDVIRDPATEKAALPAPHLSYGQESFSDIARL